MELAHVVVPNPINKSLNINPKKTLHRDKKAKGRHMKSPDS